MYNELLIGHLILLSGLESVSNHSHKQSEYKAGESYRKALTCLV